MFFFKLLSLSSKPSLSDSSNTRLSSFRLVRVDLRESIVAFNLWILSSSSKLPKLSGFIVESSKSLPVLLSSLFFNTIFLRALSKPSLEIIWALTELICPSILKISGVLICFKLASTVFNFTLRLSNWVWRFNLADIGNLVSTEYLIENRGSPRFTIKPFLTKILSTTPSL